MLHNNKTHRLVMHKFSEKKYRFFETIKLKENYEQCDSLSLLENENPSRLITLKQLCAAY